MSEIKNINSVETLQSFMHRTMVQEENMEQEAQRLVNLFRHLNVFGADYIDVFNQQLLSAPKEVILLLPTVVGGSLVRQYLEFLSRKLGIVLETTDDVSLPQGEDGYLPSPDNDIPFAASTSLSGTGSVAGGLSVEQTIDALDKIVAAQGQLFADTLEKITVETRQATARQTAEIAKALTGSGRLYTVIEDKPAEASALAKTPEADELALSPDSVGTPVTTGIPTVIDEQPAQHQFVSSHATAFETDDDIEILSEIDLPNE